MGALPKGAGRTGAAHAMTVDDAVIALIRPQPDLSLIEGEPDEIVAAARTAAEATRGGAPICLVKPGEDGRHDGSGSVGADGGALCG
ncbi:hypothetical protein ACFRCH_43050, partial [Streptomyces sp. NPDC056663]